MEYSIQEASELLSIPIQKLRRWDEQGVLVALRTSGGHRRYSKELIDRLAASGFGGASADKTSQELATVKRALAEKRRIIQLLLESENRYRDLVEFNLADSYVYFEDIKHTKPGGGSWGIADVNGAEFGVKVTA